MKLKKQSLGACVPSICQHDSRVGAEGLLDGELQGNGASMNIPYVFCGTYFEWRGAPVVVDVQATKGQRRAYS